MSDALTLRQLLSQTSEQVGSRHEARWLCEVAVGLDGAEFDQALGGAVTERMVAHLDAMLTRLETGEPIQYVLGRWSFRHLDLAIDRRVLIPRPETEVVAGVAIELANNVDGDRSVVDLGTGSGAIGLSVAYELPGTTVWLTDVSADALDVARANLAGIGNVGTTVRIGQGSWFDALPVGLQFDVVVSNPPYVAEGSPDLADSVSAWEPTGALFAGRDGLDAIRAIAAGAPRWLRAAGWLVLEIGADQGSSVRDVLEEHGYDDIGIQPDLAGRDRVAVAQRR